MQNLALSDLGIRRLKSPEDGNDYHWDAVQRGLGLRVGAGGAKTFVVLISSGRRKAIGRYPELSLQDARIAAKKMLAEITLGKRHPTNVAFDVVRDDFLKAAADANRPRTVADYMRLLKKHFPYGRSPVADVTPRDIQRRLAALNNTPSEKHHAHTALRAMFRWAVRNDYLDRSPMENMETPSNGTPRERVLTDKELKAVWQAAKAAPWPFGAMVQLLILTGQRKTEIGGLRWAWIGQDTIEYPASVTKNGRAHTFPLAPTALAIIGELPRLGEYVFPAGKTAPKGKEATHFVGVGKPLAALLLAAQVDHFTLHDLRRTFSSKLAALKVSQVVVEKLLNHVSGGTLSPIAQVYNRYDYLAEKRRALVVYERWLKQLVAS